MHPFRKNIWLLAGAFLIPVIVYTIFQLATLSEDEENINMIYQNQLDAILFSVNQYSDDVVSGWVNTLGEISELENDQDTAMQTLLFQFQPSISQVYIRDGLTAVERLYNSLGADTLLTTNAYKTFIPGPESDKLRQLRQYAEAVGFQKFESVIIPSDNHNLLLLYFIILNPENQPTNKLGAILLDPEIFISNTLSNKFQTVAKEEFVLSAFARDREQAVYTTAYADSSSNSSIAVTNNFWLLPDYYLAIGTTGTPVQDIIRQRTITNVIILLVLLLSLVVAAFLIIRNIRNELTLAQKKSDFVSNVSHELRTPLALISMFAETLELGRVTSEEKRMEYYRIMQQESSRLGGIVNKILTFSQLESGKKQFRNQKIDINEVVEHVMGKYEYHLKNKGFHHETDLNPEPLMISGDREALEEVLINLLDNAIKYSDKEKFIWVRTWREKDKGFLSVADKGIGIKKEFQGQVFEKFFRVAGGDLAQSKGTGLGLSLVEQIVNEHHGSIRLNSEIGHGSTFTVAFTLTSQDYVKDTDH